MNQNTAPSTGGQASAREMVAGNSAWIAPLRQEIGRDIVGQKHLLDRLLIAMLTNGLILLEGVPGLAKTLTLKTFASCISVRGGRRRGAAGGRPAGGGGAGGGGPR